MTDNILIIDTETTGLSAAKGDKVIEISAVLFNLTHKAVLQAFSTLLPCEENPVEKINHISAASTQCAYPYILPPYDPEKVWDDPSGRTAVVYSEEPEYFMDRILLEMARASRFLVAHNAEFDKGFIATLNCGRELLDRTWICTRKNFTWPVPLARLRLEDVCNGMGVPYVQAHRALADCLLLAQCFQRVDDLLDRFNKADPFSAY